MQGTAKAILLRPRPHPFPRQQPKKPSRGETPEAPQSTAGRSDAWEHPKRAKGGRADPPRGEKTSLAKVVGGERGKIGQTKISSKGEKEREELMEPEETVTALKIRERVRSKKEGEEDRSGKDGRVELKGREKGGNSMEESAGGQTQSRAMEKGMCNVTKRGRGGARGGWAKGANPGGVREGKVREGGVWEMGGKTSTLRPELKKGEGGRDGRAGEVQGRTKEVGAGEV